MTPRTDNPLRDFQTGAWLWTMGVCILGYWLTIMGERRV